MRYWLALLACVALSGGAAHALPVTLDEAEDARAAKMSEALAFIHQGKAADAIRTLDPLLAEFEKQYADAKGPIFCASEMGQTVELLAATAASLKPGQQAVAIGPTWCFALWGKGYSLVELGKVEEAVPYLSRATTMMPERAQFASELGYAHQTLRQTQLSLDAYREAESRARRIKDTESRNFELRRALYGIGFDLIELGKLDEAEATLNKALEVAPGDKKILSELDYIRGERAKAKPAD